MALTPSNTVSTSFRLGAMGNVVFGAAALSVILTAGSIYRDFVSFAEVSEQLNTSQQIALVTTNLLSALKDAESVQRGFMLAGRKTYLQPYDLALTEVPRT